jgi:hypothetical protein
VLVSSGEVGTNVYVFAGPALASGASFTSTCMPAPAYRQCFATWSNATSWLKLTFTS